MRVRLFLSYAFIVLATVTAVVWIARQGAAQEVRSFMMRGGLIDSAQLAASLETHYRQTGSWANVETVLDTPGRGGGRGAGREAGGMMGRGGMMASQRLRVADAGGNLVYDSWEETLNGALSSAEIGAALPLQNDGRVIGYLLGEGGMAFSAADETYLLGRINRAALIAGLIASGLSLLAALLLTASLLHPVQALTHAAERLGAGDLSQRVAAHGRDELALLGQSFNRMAGSLERMEESRRAMTADIAHELRTPVAVQRAHLEALEDGIYPLTLQNLKPILDQNLTLTRLVDDLRTLTLADTGQLQLERMPVDPVGLVEQIVHRYQPEAAARRIALDFEPAAAPAAVPAGGVSRGGARPAAISPPPVQNVGRLVWADPVRIEQILANLLTNALRYTPEGGRVWVHVVFGARSVEIVVYDSGAGIPAEALPFIFERFYRSDRARSREAGGAGLGLAIARKLAEAHGGTLTAANRAQGGAEFKLALPLGS